MEKPPTTSPSRRRLLRTLAGPVGGLVTLGALPDKWVKPIVEVAIIPAHARSSPVVQEAPSLIQGASPYSLSVVTTTPSGGTIPYNHPIYFHVIVRPNPGSGQSVTVEVMCSGDNNYQPSPAVTTNDVGHATGTAQNLCLRGSGVHIRWTCMGATTEAFWNISQF